MIKRVINDSVLEIYENDDLVMSLSETIKDGEMSVRISGAIKSTVAHELEDELMAAVSFCSAINVDMSQVSFISGNALRSLLTVQRVADDSGTALVIEYPSEAVQAVFDESGFSDLLELRY